MFTKPLQFHSEHGLGILQLGTSDQDTFQCLPVSQAMEQGTVTVKEVSESGSVNDLLLLNHSKQFVFLMDGDILSGAKQNRVVNTSILLAPESQTKIPVSCVEAGRWGYRSRTFSPTPYAAPSFLRAMKARHVAQSLKATKKFSADQSRVWSEVADYQARLGMASETSNLSDVYDRRRKEIFDIISRFTLNTDANGVAVFFGTRLASVDLFNSRELYKHYFPKILQGAAFEDRRPYKGDVSEAEASFRAVELIDKLDTAPFDEYDAVGTGRERRFDLGPVHSSQLLYQTHMVHTGMFNETPRS